MWWWCGCGGGGGGGGGEMSKTFNTKSFRYFVCHMVSLNSCIEFKASSVVLETPLRSNGCAR